MAGSKEIRTKIKSVENTRKITRAMEMVAAAKMRKSQQRMRAARPYAEKIRQVAAHLSHANSEYSHPYLVKRDAVKNVGIILITSDKGLCGGLNTNVLRMALAQMKQFEAKGTGIRVTPIGNKGFSFMSRIGAKIESHLIGLGDTPRIESMIGTVKVMLDAYVAGEVDAVYISYNHFVNTMKQEPVFEQLLPLSGENLNAEGSGSWDYIYEPDAQAVIDEMLLRYVESLVYTAVSENQAAEQSARMVAMKAASDNAKAVIGELKLVYNKARQAAITKEISEIVGGAAAVS
ncbi:MAG: F0F1 ATP synthase subunit gamma [Gallionellales bacterium 35-53-114]|jgi:F-type H+-transporting ATPase subunit gamma|nr:MAG: F0F1 ATP synthase subunit gamma [Gallionellales bacterium 35-53-114]OYZ63584.1 MAG: F0F1 ATP synthase subunit gamma [Gallionellales bacterium 24-53-125]OZB10806.1 MAG: F0F1 ATP synthase subunit gamma [Gallionellales bacterium 39-52-133]HQS59023.1 F0F1 ATP synthase subunit gamma [Gallionellaceae bacterium]HQS75592.1 F0F1 ATP synthase subunit gamma [Gallionellaceae bacterium]